MRLATRFLAPLALLSAMLIPAGAATAAPAQIERFEDVNFGINCNEEFVVAFGTFHIVSKAQNDGSFINNITFHGQGFGDQGGQYVVHDTIKSRSTSSTSTFDGRFRLISKGSEPNLVVLVHIDSDGEFTSEPECRG